jgi:hypothetical protein
MSGTSVFCTQVRRVVSPKKLCQNGQFKSGYRNIFIETIAGAAKEIVMRLCATSLNLSYECKIVMREIKVSPYPTAAENSAEHRAVAPRLHHDADCRPRKKRGLPFSKETHTASVNAHGCIVRIAEKVARGQEVAILNPKTVEELPCTATFVGQKDSGKTEVGLEFIEPSPLFWRVTFPPEDGDLSERKRATSASTRALPQRKRT